MKKIPLTAQEHTQLAEDLSKAQILLEPWVNRIFKAHKVSSRECRLLHNLMILLSTIGTSQENHWYKIPFEEIPKSIDWKNSPYEKISLWI